MSSSVSKISGKELTRYGETIEKMLAAYEGIMKKNSKKEDIKRDVIAGWDRMCQADREKKYYNKKVQEWKSIRGSNDLIHYIDRKEISWSMTGSEAFSFAHERHVYWNVS